MPWPGICEGWVPLPPLAQMLSCSSWRGHHQRQQLRPPSCEHRATHASESHGGRPGPIRRPPAPDPRINCTRSRRAVLHNAHARARVRGLTKAQCHLFQGRTLSPAGTASRQEPLRGGERRTPEDDWSAQDSSERAPRAGRRRAGEQSMRGGRCNRKQNGRCHAMNRKRLRVFRKRADPSSASCHERDDP